MEDQFDKIIAIASVCRPSKIDNADSLDEYNKQLNRLEKLCHAVIGSKGGTIDRLPANMGVGDGFELSIPVDHAEALRELVDRSFQESELHTVIGVGHDVIEAKIAAKYAKESGAHDDIIVYHPDMQMLEESQMTKAEPDEEEQKDIKDPIEHAKQVLASIKENMPMFEAMREERPEVYKAVVETLKSLVEAVADQKEEEQKHADKGQQSIDKESQKREDKESKEFQGEVASQSKQVESSREVKPSPEGESQIVGSGIDSSILQAIANNQQEVEVGNSHYDPLIEKDNYDDEEDPQFAKKLRYVMKYGKLYE